MRRSCLAFTLLLVASPALAWNGFGHMTVAAIAYDKLTPAAKARAAALLKLNPMYNQWVAGVADADKDRTAFVLAATWPDAIKSKSAGYTDDGEHPSGPASARNIGYKDKLMHRYWHFIDTPFSPDGTPLVQPVAPNAQTQIALFRKALRSASTSDDVKSYDLVWLEHLVGDVHQPLHATSRFTKDLPTGDSGGNLVEIDSPKELHAFWDDILGTSTRPASAEKQASTIKAAPAKSAAISDEGKWIEESFEAAKSSAYIAPIGPSKGPFVLNDAYKLQAGKVALKRVALAGARLANLLNDALK